MSTKFEYFGCNRCGEDVSLDLPREELRDHDLPCSNCRVWGHSACNCPVTPGETEDEA